MRRWIAGALAVALLGSSMVGTAALAAPAKTRAAKTMKCPFCGMMMPNHKTATMSVPVKIKGVTYYCCTACKGGKKPPPTKHM
jgi:YHS domain-containing protein